MQNRTIGRSSSGGSSVPVATRVLPSQRDAIREMEKSSVTPDDINSAFIEASSGNLGPLQGLYRRSQTTDPRIRGLREAFRAALMASPLRVFESPAKSRAARQAGAMARDLVRTTSRHRTTGMMVQPYLSGVSVFAPRYNDVKSETGKLFQLPNEIREVSPALLRVDRKKDSKTYGQLAISTEKEPKGEVLSAFEPGSLLMLADGTSEGQYEMAGALRACLPWWYLKNSNALYWGEFNAHYGHPHLLGYYDIGASEEEKVDMIAYMRYLQRNAFALFPKDMEIEFKDVSRTGQVAIFSDIIDLCNTEITICLAGQTQTSDGGDQGSYAKANVHNRIRYEVMKSIGAIVEEGYQALLTFAAWHNISPDFDPYELPSIRLTIPNPEDNEKKARVFQIYQRLGGVLDDSFVCDELGITPHEHLRGRALVPVEAGGGDSLPERPQPGRPPAGE
ncbi:MAG: DUF935 domain-containing protein [Bacteroidetes bacterium]|nr:DUF935 domain-containing protein [Bacteroidota bacterium]